MAHIIEYAFRLVHIDNIPLILKYGIVRKNSVNASSNYVPIGDNSIINIRATKKVLNNRTLSDFIPFYFGPRSPMLYVIQKGFNNVARHNADDIVYLVIKISDVINKGIKCYFTDGHALDSLTKFYESNRLNQLNQIVDYDDVYQKYWCSDDDLDLKRRKEAELLIDQDLPANFIKGIVVYSIEAREKIIGYGVPESLVVVKPCYYF